MADYVEANLRIGWYGRHWLMHFLKKKDMNYVTLKGYVRRYLYPPWTKEESFVYLYVCPIVCADLCLAHNLF